MNSEQYYSISIQDVAERLGIEIVSERSARCFNKYNHKHLDRNPSLIFGKRNTWNCAVCQFTFGGKSYGNNIDLDREYFGVEFKEAIQWFRVNFIATDQTTTDPDINYINTPVNDDHHKICVTDIEIYTQIIKICGTIGDSFRRYLRERGLSDFIIDVLHITSVKQETGIQLQELFNMNELICSGLYRISTRTHKPYFTFFNHKLLFPFYYMEDVVYLHGRRSGNTKLKYINLPKELIFPYNVNILTHSDIYKANVLICEGIIDTLSLLDKNINSIAIIGSNNFKREWVGLFDLYEVNPVIALDEDSEGDKGAQSLANIFNRSLIRVLPSKFGTGKDWNDLVSRRIECKN